MYCHIPTSPPVCPTILQYQSAEHSEIACGCFVRIATVFYCPNWQWETKIRGCLWPTEWLTRSATSDSDPATPTPSLTHAPRPCPACISRQHDIYAHRPRCTFRTVLHCTTARNPSSIGSSPLSVIQTCPHHCIHSSSHDSNRVSSIEGVTTLCHAASEWMQVDSDREKDMEELLMSAHLQVALSVHKICNRNHFVLPLETISRLVNDSRSTCMAALGPYACRHYFLQSLCLVWLLFGVRLDSVGWGGKGLVVLTSYLKASCPLFPCPCNLRPRLPLSIRGSVLT